MRCSFCYDAAQEEGCNLLHYAGRDAMPGVSFGSLKQVMHFQWHTVTLLRRQAWRLYKIPKHKQSYGFTNFLKKMIRLLFRTVST